MKKPSFSQALAAEQVPPPLEKPQAVPAAKPKKSDGRVTTTIRIEETWLDALKQVALNKKTKLNDLLRAGARHILEMENAFPKDEGKK